MGFPSGTSKKDGTERYCIDSRNLNAVTIKDSYPLPTTDDSLDALRKVKYFSTLGLAWIFTDGIFRQCKTKLCILYNHGSVSISHGAL